jgi:predicted dehydrogenase
MGIHDRGMDLAAELMARKDVELRYLADPDSRLFAERAARVEQRMGKAPQCLQDFRHMLDDPEIDAICIATPDHWHALATILACQAGKDVYVEKPTSQSIWESGQMVKAARKYERIVQVGTQNRSAEYCYQALDYVRSPDFGDIHFVRIMNSKKRQSMTALPDSATPSGVDYDMWLGPAPKREFNQNHFHYNWHWYWRYGGGDVANDGVHQIDLARWMANVSTPNSVQSTGGRYVLDDVRETPDTQSIAYSFDGLTMVLEMTLWSPYMKKTPFELRDTDSLPNWPFSGTRIDIYGSKQFMFLGRMGGGWQAFDGDGKSVSIQPGRFSPSNTSHMANFLDCVRSRKRPNADIEEGHRSTLLAHYGNLAYRTGRTLNIDPQSLGFKDDTDANKLIRRSYRKPWVVPENV